MNPSKASDYDSEPGAQRVAPQIRTPVIPSATDLEDWLKPRLLLSTPQVSGCGFAGQQFAILKST